ncbi:uncharacterized protein Hap1MRO34_022691 [Clarias gariepinus]|uniref:CD209 antigen-like protein 2 n=1 Tax=Clarias gariepinus TaxID=13013 RepID=UPI00234E043F|nr:CD209 antigen-like protein 2 [Clarias gariepinus]
MMTAKRRMEMSEEIYANTEITEDNRADNRNSENSNENVYVNRNNLETRKEKSFKQSSGGKTIRRTMVAVCVLLLCALMLTALTVLWINFNILNSEKDRLQTSNNNLTIERDHLQTSYNNLTIERDHLQTSYNNLTIEREHLQTSYNNLTIARDQLLSSYSTLITEKDQLKRDREELRRLFKLGWTYFSSSIYYISAMRKSWPAGRQDCSERGANLVTINSREEQEFISKLLCSRKAWIGLNDRDIENQWKWVDSTPLMTSLWRRGEPNGARSENCVITGELSDPVWNWADYPCNYEFIWICKKVFFLN